MVEWQDVNGCYELPIFELYWSDLTRIRLPLVGRIWSYWQLFAGLPRLGLYALPAPLGAPSARKLHIARLSFISTWCLLIFRLVVNTFLLLAANAPSYVAFIGFFQRNSADITLYVDLLVDLCFLIFLFTLVKLRPVRANQRINTMPALLTLSLAWIITQSVPLAIQRQLEHWQLARIPESPPFFSDPTTLAGLLPYAGFGLVVLWALTTALPLALQCLFRIERWNIDWFACCSRRWWVAISFTFLFIIPMVDFLTLGLQCIFGWPIPLVDLESSNHVEAWLANKFVTCSELIAYLCAGLMFALMFSSRWRVVLNPVVEFMIDLINYFPPVDGLDKLAPVRYLLGGRRPANEQGLDYGS